MLTKTLMAASVIALGLSACNKAEETSPNSTPSPAATSPAPVGGSSSTTMPAPATPGSTTAPSSGGTTTQ
ncbi:MAG: endopeptidase [Burkholderiaceae bacterium]|nr:endopeptidase [Burkholderiaceae bacterium]